MSTNLQVYAKPHPFQAPRAVEALPVGLTLQEIVDEIYARSDVPAALRVGTIVQVNGEAVPREMWGRIKPKEMANVVISTAVHGGGGGKNPLAMVLAIAVIAAAPYAATLLAPEMAFASGVYGALGITNATTIGFTALQMGITAAGLMAVNALAPPRMARGGGLAGNSYNDSPTYSITGARNAANLYGPVPVVLGRHRMTPPLGAQSYTEIVGKDEYLRMLFVWGYGPLKIEDIRIGETPISDFTDVEIETREGRPNDAPITLIPASVIQDQIGTPLRESTGWVQRTSRDDTDELSVDIVFPRGLVRFTDSGARASQRVRVDIEYRPAGGSTWTALRKESQVAARTNTFQASFTQRMEYDDGSYRPVLDGNGNPIYDPVATTWGVYVNLQTGAVSYRQGTAAIEDHARVGSVVVTGNNITSVTNLSPAEVTGCVVSQSGAASARTINITAGVAYGNVFDITAADVVVLRYGHRWKVPRGRYDVRLRRVTPDNDSDRIIDDVAWSALRTIRDEPPTAFDKPLAMTAIRIKATDQLQGVIDNLNALVTSYAPDWNGSTWVERPTQNPASLVRLVLTGPANARARTLNQVDNENLAEFHEFCAENGFKFNMIRDFAASVWETVADITAAARAAPTMIDGRWGVVIDRAGKPVVQHFTPRNSWGFQSEKALYDPPHAWRIRFVNEQANFEQDERIVYDDGYSKTNATQFEGLDSPGITDPDLVWKYGRFQIAQARLRPEIYSLYADFEHLACQRGDLIRVSHDVPMWGGGNARVKSVLTEGGNTVGVVLDDLVAMEAGKDYVCRFRMQDGSSIVLRVVNPGAGEYRQLSFTNPVPTSQGPQWDDLAMFGEPQRETVELLVRAIEPGPDLTAKITCIDAAPAVYRADQGAIPPFDPNITKPIDPTRFPPPVPIITAVESGTAALVVAGNGFLARILVSLSPGDGTTRTARFKVRYRAVGQSSWSSVEIDREDGAASLDAVSEGVTYEFQAQAISVYGVASEWTERRQETVIGQSERPANVQGFRVNVIDGNAYLSWIANTEIDLSHYHIRWSPTKQGATWADAVDVVARASGTSVTVPGMVGTYMIKAVDFAGNDSEVAAAAITNIARVQGLNFVEAISEQTPDWNGVGDGVGYWTTLGGLALEGSDLYDSEDLYTVYDLYVGDGLVPEGTYTLPEIVDLREPFTVRVTARLDTGMADVASDLYAVPDLYAVENLYGPRDDSVAVFIEMQMTDGDPEDESTWSAWDQFLVGDYTARAFRFRLRLIGSARTVTPIVYGVHVEVDMQDRVVGFNAVVPVDGSRVHFTPAFFVKPEIGISVFDGQEGDRYTITNEGPDGFDIAFTNSGNPVSRSISGVARAYGEAA